MTFITAQYRYKSYNLIIYLLGNIKIYQLYFYALKFGKVLLKYFNRGTKFYSSDKKTNLLKQEENKN